MDQAPLVGQYIEYGRQAVALLESKQIRIGVALLAFLPEYDDWRLVLSSPDLDQKHPLKASDKLFEALDFRFVNRLPPVLILPTKDPMVREVQSIFSGLNSVKPGDLVRLSGNTLGGRFVHDGFLYQVRPARTLSDNRRKQAGRAMPSAPSPRKLKKQVSTPRGSAHLQRKTAS